MPLSSSAGEPRRKSRKRHEDEPNTAKSDEPSEKLVALLSRTSSRLTRSLSALSLGRSRSDVTASSSVSDTRKPRTGLVLEEIGRGAFSTVVQREKGSPRTRAACSP